MSDLARLMERLWRQRSVRDKVAIREAYAQVGPAHEQSAPLGDDCAALPDGEQAHLLFAAEGLLTDFVEGDPWFAGYSAVMVNLSDIAAMGGRALAIVDVLWTPDHSHSALLWEGMRAASHAYGVPIVGGHTTLTRPDAPMHLAAAVLGRASALMTSFDAQPGDDLLMAVDLRGSFRRDKPFWNASTGRPHEELRSGLELLPEIAERGLCRAAKDISNGGVLGTLVMLLECSKVGATLDLASIPRPEATDLFRWLISFPSYGFLLSVAPAQRRDVTRTFQEAGIACRSIGHIDPEASLHVELRGERSEFWRAPEPSEERRLQ